VTWYTPQEGVLGTKYAHVLDASTAKRGVDSFGQITSGVIRIACSGMAVGHLAQSKKSPTQGAENTSIILMLSGNEKQEFSIGLDCLEDARLEDNTPVHLLPILGGRTGHSWHKGKKEEDPWVDEMMIEGVVLRAIGVKQGEFSRIGSFNYYKGMSSGFVQNQNLEELYEPLLKLLGERGVMTAEAVCEEVVSDPEHPDDRYVITII
jgi:hypothetical protein